MDLWDVKRCPVCRADRVHYRRKHGRDLTCLTCWPLSRSRSRSKPPRSDEGGNAANQVGLSP